MLAMHIPDGFLDAPTSLVGGLIAIIGVAFCLHKTSQSLDERDIPVVGLVAAFVFAAQMLNFPIANGTSGHLMGGVLAAVLVGPYAGALAVTVVLVVQALLFADGGLSALGLNVVNMALIGAFGGYGIFLLIRKLVPSVTIAAGLAGFTAPVLASIGFTLQYAVGGNDAVSVASLATAMIGVHILIGVGEGIITALAVGSVMATRPDLVYGARTAPRRLSTPAFVGLGIVTAVLLVVFVAPFANPNPDGLERVAADNGIDAAVTDHDLAGSPLADYGVDGVDNAMFGTGLAGIAGIVATLVVGVGLVWIVRRRRNPSAPPAAAPTG
jgi:cobalt/nickel transport system permease protein